MNFGEALRLTELLGGCALLQQSLEHCVGPPAERGLFAVRALLAVALALGLFPGPVAVLLLGLGALSLRRFDGPYNGGADRMSLLLLFCVAGAHLAPVTLLAEASLAYLAAQLVICYFMAGWVKLVNPDWRSGQALVDVFAFSAYPVSAQLRALSRRPRLMCAAARAIVGFELIFPLALLDRPALGVACALAAILHTANACLFGLNRFLWIWLAAWPSLWWLQSRLGAG
jgi:hypothetical protein